jgi:predicted nuclease of predicted toxin-antitoxin system
LKLFLDTCIGAGTVEHLRRAGHDVVWSGEWDSDPGDEDLLAKASREGRVVITLDKDFGELAVVRRAAHHGIVRLVGFRVDAQGHAAAETLERYPDELAAGAIVTVERSRVRVRPGEG